MHKSLEVNLLLYDVEIPNDQDETVHGDVEDRFRDARGVESPIGKTKLVSAPVR